MKPDRPFRAVCLKVRDDAPQAEVRGHRGWRGRAARVKAGARGGEGRRARWDPSCLVILLDRIYTASLASRLPIYGHLSSSPRRTIRERRGSEGHDNGPQATHWSTYRSCQCRAIHRSTDHHLVVLQRPARRHCMRTLLVYMTSLQRYIWAALRLDARQTAQLVHRRLLGRG